ncbi:MAG TPA: hypothetical protein VJH05_02455 [Candidatus Paceibacterota bacterium]
MKKLACFLFVAIFVVLSTASARTFVHPELQSSRPDLPWYFPEGILGDVQDPIQQLIEFERYLTVTKNCMQNNLTSFMADANAIRVKTDIKSTSSVTDPNTNMEIILHHHVRIGDKVRVSTLCEQKFLGETKQENEQRLEVVVKDLINSANEAADLDFNHHKDLIEGSIKSLAEQFEVSIEELKKRLPEKDPLSGFTFREIYGIPEEMKRSDFVPRELHLGYLPQFPGVLGVAYLNTGVVFLNPQARIADYLMGKPIILAHEFVHTNSNLQKFPFADSFNAELFASFVMLLPNDSINFFFHPYPQSWRKIMKVYSGFDFNEAIKKIIVIDLGGYVVINEEEYRKAFLMVEKLKKIVLEIDLKAKEAYYSNQLWWAAFNEKLKDPDVVYKMVMAQNFEPTLLDGREKTMKHVMLRREMIKDVTKEALEKLDDGSSNNPTETVRAVPDFALSFYNNSFSSVEKANIEKYFTGNKKAVDFVRKMKAEDAFKFLKSIGTGGVR